MHIEAVVKLVSTIGVFLLGYAFVKYNCVILKGIHILLGKVSLGLHKLFGAKLQRASTKFTALANLNKKTKKYKFYSFFDNVLVVLELRQYGITVFGFVLFIAVVALILTIILQFILPMGVLVLLVLPAIFFLLVVVIKLSALTKQEKHEAMVMDAVDLIVSDVRGGIYNAIIRYTPNINAGIRQYFVEFIDNIQTKGFGFNVSMMILNERLGDEFSDFASKAIMYEEKADASMIEIFSGIVESNRQKRILRYENGIAFAQIRNVLYIATLAIVGYAIFCIMLDDFIRVFLTENIFGNILLIVDIVAYTCVLMYVTKLKSGSLEG